MNLNSKERNTLYIPTCEFNLTWSKFPIPIRFTEISSNGQYKNNKNFIQKIIRHSTNFKPDFDKNINKKIISFKNKNINVKKDSTPQKITINRRKMENKQKNEKKSKLKGNNNSSMKNMKHINYTKPKINDEFCINNIKENLINLTDNNKMIKTQNNFYNKGDIGIDLDQFDLFGEEEKPFNLDDENIPRGINPEPRKDAKYLRVKLKYLLSDLRIYGLMKHYIPSIDENDPKTIIPVFKIVMNKFEQNMIGKNISKESDENYLENEVEFDVRFIDKLKEQIKNIIKKKNGEKSDFYDIKHSISGKYNQLLLDKIIKLLLQSLVNTGEIYMEDKYAYKYALY